MWKSDSYSNWHWKKTLVIIQCNHLPKTGSVKLGVFFNLNNISCISVLQFMPLELSVFSLKKAEKGLSLSPLHFCTGYLHIKCLFFSRLEGTSSLSPPCVSDAPAFNHLHSPSLGLLQHIHVSCAEEPRSGHGNGTLDGAPPGWVKWKDHSPQPTGKASSHQSAGYWLSLPQAQVGDSCQTGAHQEYIKSDWPPTGHQLSTHRRLLSWLNTIFPSEIHADYSQSHPSSSCVSEGIFTMICSITFSRTEVRLISLQVLEDLKYTLSFSTSFDKKYVFPFSKNLGKDL